MIDSFSSWWEESRKKKRGSSACKIIMLNKSDTVMVMNFYNLYLWLYFYCTVFMCQCSRCLHHLFWYIVVVVVVVWTLPFENWELAIWSVCWHVFLFSIAHFHKLHTQIATQRLRSKKHDWSIVVVVNQKQKQAVPYEFHRFVSFAFGIVLQAIHVSFNVLMFNCWAFFSSTLKCYSNWMMNVLGWCQN